MSEQGVLALEFGPTARAASRSPSRMKADSHCYLFNLNKSLDCSIDPRKVGSAAEVVEASKSAKGHFEEVDCQN